MRGREDKREDVRVRGKEREGGWEGEVREKEREGEGKRVRGREREGERCE